MISVGLMFEELSLPKKHCDFFVAKFGQLNFCLGVKLY